MAVSSFKIGTDGFLTDYEVAASTQLVVLARRETGQGYPIGREARRVYATREPIYRLQNASSAWWGYGSSVRAEKEVGSGVVMPKKKSRKKLAIDLAVAELRAFGLTYPGAHLKSPWPGHKDLAVNDKTFAYLSIEGEPLAISCKLPSSGQDALMLPFTKPTAYGLGKSGWVSASFAEGEPVPVGMLKEWIDESYRAQAPKRLVAQLDAAARPSRR